MHALSINGLEKIYRSGTHALTDVSLTIPSGDFFALYLLKTGLGLIA